MPTFMTPGPIRVAIKLAGGEVAIIASDRSDTVVTVAPYDPAQARDVRSAKRVEIDCTADGLRIRQPGPWRYRYRRSGPGTVAITVELPSGSQVRGDAALGTFRSQGLLGRCEFTASYGGVELDEVGDDLRVRSSSGSILVQRAHAGVDARISVGNIRIGEVVRGTVDVATSVGEVELGVRPGTAAHLDVRSRMGRIHNMLTPGEPPAPATSTVKIRARTSLDDIVIRHS